MWRFLIVFLVSVLLLAPAFADSDREDDVQRIQSSAEVLKEVMSTPDKAIPQELLESAKCIVVIPGEMKAAFIFGGRYGKGLATCKTASGWSAPLFLTVGGGSFGLQIGASSTDIVMLIMNHNGMKSLLSDKMGIRFNQVRSDSVARLAAAGIRHYYIWCLPESSGYPSPTNLRWAGRALWLRGLSGVTWP